MKLRRARSEREIVAAILAYLKTTDVVAWRNNTGAVTATYRGKSRFVRFGVPGAPDIIGYRSIVASVPITPMTNVMRCAQFIAVEVKRPGVPTTALQDAFLVRVRQAGGIGIVATSVTDVVRALQ